jgi:hypothetical protein
MQEMRPYPGGAGDGRSDQFRSPALAWQQSNGASIDHDYERMVVLFSLRDGEKEMPRATSTSAMDELDGVVSARADQRETQFMSERVRVCASVKYQASELEGTLPCIILRSIDLRHGCTSALG